MSSQWQNHLHQISAPLAVILNGHMTSLQQFWVQVYKLAPNHLERAPIWPQICPERHQCLQSDFRNHLHHDSAPFEVVSSGNMTSLLWDKWKKLMLELILLSAFFWLAKIMSPVYMRHWQLIRSKLGLYFSSGIRLDIDVFFFGALPIDQSNLIGNLQAFCQYIVADMLNLSISI